MKRLSLVIFAPIAALLASCQSVPSADSTPAIITNPSSEVHAEITAAVFKALNKSNITLADDILTRKSTLIIERAAHAVMGRDYERPEHFRLTRHTNGCFLTHTESGHYTKLKKAKCRALAP